MWVYTGVTSATADNSIVGFVLVNQRTAEAHFYSVSGATEDRAMQSAEGAVQDLGYSSTFPILINVADRPTYFMSLKDGAGTVKQFAMVDIQSYNNVAVGATVADCQKSYEALLATNGVLTESGSDAGALEARGTIDHIAQAVVEGNSHFYVTLAEGEGIFDFALPGLIEIVGYKEGDAISFTYLETSPHQHGAGDTGGAGRDAGRSGGRGGGDGRRAGRRGLAPNAGALGGVRTRRFLRVLRKGG